MKRSLDLRDTGKTQSKKAERHLKLLFTSLLVATTASHPATAETQSQSKVCARAEHYINKAGKAKSRPEGLAKEASEFLVTTKPEENTPIATRDLACLIEMAYIVGDRKIDDMGLLYENLAFLYSSDKAAFKRALELLPKSLQGKILAQAKRTEHLQNYGDGPKP